MPSIDERAHAAAMLRAIAPEFPERHGTGTIQPSWPTLFKALGTTARRETVERLADLIEPEPERTCRVEYRYRDDEPWPYAACSECGAALSYYDTVDERGEESSDLCPFCPNCGARVVEP